jgi:hypothetical protein
VSIGGELHYFLMRMAGQGWSDHGIAAATRLSVEQVRRIMGNARAAHAAKSAQT